MTALPTRAITFLSHRKPPFELLVRGVQANPRIIYAIAVALGCNSYLPELEGRNLLLKAPDTWDTTL